MAHKRLSFLQNFSFLLLLIGQFISNLGLMCTYVTISWITYKLTNSTLTMGQLLLVFSIAQLFGRLFSGSLLDRLNLRNVLVFTDFSTGLFLFLLLLLFASQHLQLWQLYLIVALVGEEGFMPVGFLIGGLLGEVISLRYLLLGTGFLLCLFPVVCFFIPFLSQIDDLSDLKREKLSPDKK